MYSRDNLLIKGKYLENLIPTILTTMSISLASVVDGAIVGNLLGNNALAAIGLSGPIIYGINAFIILFSAGGIVSAAKAKGEGNQNNADIFFTLAILLGSLILVLFASIITIFAKPIAFLLAQGDKQLARMVAIYISSIVWAGPFTTISLTLAQFWKVDGSPRASTLVSIIANLVNLALDYILIKYFDAGILGAGISTVLGYWASFFVLLLYFFSRKRTFHFVGLKWTDFRNICTITKIGLSKALNAGTSILRNLILNGLIVMSFGALGMSAMTICINVLMVARIFVSGSTETLSIIGSTLLGEKDFFGVRATIKKSIEILTCFCVILTLLFVCFPEVMGKIFGVGSTDALAVLKPAIRFFALSIPFYGINQLFQNYYAISGREKLATIISVLDGLVFVVCFALIFIHINPQFIWLCFLFSEVLTIGTVWFLSNRLKKREKNVSTLFLLPASNTSVSWDRTIGATTEDATKLSVEMISFCKDNGLDGKIANHIGLAIEEMAVNTAMFNENKNITIDIMIQISAGETLLRLRDNGKIFNPTNESNTAQYNSDGIQLIKKIATKVEFSCLLGFNITIITLENNIKE